MVDLVVLASVLRATTKKVVNFFALPLKYFSLEPLLVIRRHLYKKNRRTFDRAKNASA